MQSQLPDLSLVVPALLSAVPIALVIVFCAVVLNLVIGRGLAALAGRTSFTQEELVPLRRIVKWVITIGAGVFILAAFGMNVSGMWGILSTVFAMVAIGFVAVWSVLSNTLCALFIILVRPFSVGDEVEFAGDPVKGRVVDLNFLYTTLSAGDGTLLQVPNNLFFQKVLRRRPAAHSARALNLRSQQSETPTEPAATL